MNVFCLYGLIKGRESSRACAPVAYSLYGWFLEYKMPNGVEIFSVFWRTSVACVSRHMTRLCKSVGIGSGSGSGGTSKGAAAVESLGLILLG